MDHFAFIKTMPVRRLVMVAFLGLGAALLFVVWGAWLFLGAGGLHPLGGLAQGSPLSDRQRHVAHEVPDPLAENGGPRFHRESHCVAVLA